MLINCKAERMSKACKNFMNGSTKVESMDLNKDNTN